MVLSQVSLVLKCVVSLSEKLQKMTLTSENTASQSEDPPEAGKELKLCVNQQEMETIVKSLLQVLMGKSEMFTVSRTTIVHFHVHFFG